MKKFLISAAMCLVAALGVQAQNEWLHIYRNNNTINTGLATEIDSVSFKQSAESDTLYSHMTISRNGKAQTLAMSEIDSIVVGTNVPTVYIDIENGAEVVVKETYLNAKIRIEGYGHYDDFAETDVTIRGRGNSTWNMAKKPYRLKFAKKQSLFGFRKAKSFALIANFIDCSLMRNPFALELGKRLGLEFTNTFVPFNLVMNGSYRGTYMMTEKIGIGGGSVDIDEETSVLFEFDTNYDENYKFHSNTFRVPVMVKDPDFDELAEVAGSMTAQQRLEKWKAEFHKLESTLSSYGTPSADFVNQMDIETLVNYLIVFNISGNREPHHPKSVYMYKTEGEGQKFKMGPVWDFDWAYTFDGQEGNGPYNSPLFNGSEAGDNFFKAMLRSPEVMKRFRERWNEFATDIYPEMLKFVDDYAAMIEVSAAQNGEVWPAGTYGSYRLKGTETFRTNVKEFKTWLQNRMDYCNNHANLGLF